MKPHTNREPDGELLMLRIAGDSDGGYLVATPAVNRPCWTK
jgi:hypothetical protein